MKRFKIFTICVLIASLMLTACDGFPILASIELEIKLKPANIPGTVRNICPLTSGDLYTSNGKIYKKVSGSSSWSEISLPVENAICSSLATNGTAIYATFIDNFKDGSKGVYKYDGSWKKISGSENIQAVFDGANVLGVEFEKGKNEEENTSKVYTITGTTLSSIATIKGKHASITASGGAYFATSEKLYKISDGSEVTPAPSGIVAISKDGEYIVTSDKVFKSSDLNAGVAHNVSSPSAVTPINANRQTILLITSNVGGYNEVQVDTTTFSNSKPIAIGSENSTTPSGSAPQYRGSVGKFPAHKIYAETTTDGYVIYIAVNDPNFARYSGLWSFYSPSPREWNRE